MPAHRKNAGVILVLDLHSTLTLMLGSSCEGKYCFSSDRVLCTINGFQGKSRSNCPPSTFDKDMFISPNSTPGKKIVT